MGQDERPIEERVKVGDTLLVKAPFFERTGTTWKVVVKKINRKSNYPFSIKILEGREGRQDFKMVEGRIIKIIEEDQ